MIKPLAAILPLLAAAASFASPPAVNNPNAPLHGTWRNSLQTVDVRIEDCGPLLCGIVVGATSAALTDARDSGYPNLVGMQLLQGYHADRHGRWVGTVLVPDLGHSFSSHIELVDADHARIAGCLWRQYFCQSQLWRRL